MLRTPSFVLQVEGKRKPSSTHERKSQIASLGLQPQRRWREEMEVSSVQRGTGKSGVTIQGGWDRSSNVWMAALVKGDTQDENNKRNERRMEQQGLQHPQGK